MALFTQKDSQELIRYLTDSALLVDFDGTLVDLVPNPDEISVPRELVALLDAAAQKEESAFAIITGRSIGKLDRFLGVSTAAIGSHGAECRPGREAKVEHLAAPIPPAVRDRVQKIGERHNCIYEDKIFSLSLHLPFEQMARDVTTDIIDALDTDASDYLVRRVGRTYEILWRGVTKGSGIVHLMKQPGFADRRPVYIGDDVNTDDSLKVVRDLGGMLIPVRHTQYAEANTGDILLEVGDVRNIVRAFV